MDSIETIKFSIVIPCYNSEKYIMDCIKSILEQTYHNYEVIIIDDGSIDCTASVVEGADLDNRFQLYKKVNSGVADARNIGIEYASGDWITFLDSDDQLPSNALAVAFYSIIENPEVDILQGNMEYIIKGKPCVLSMPKKMVYSNMDNLLENIIANEYGRIKFEGRLGDSRSIGAKFYRHALLKENSLRLPSGIKVFEDGLFNLLAYGKAKSIVVLPDIIYQYNMNKDSATHKYSELKNNQYGRILREIRGTADVTGKYKVPYDYCRFDLLYILMNEIVNRSDFHSFSSKKEAIEKLISDEDYLGCVDGLDESFMIRRKRVALNLVKQNNCIGICFYLKSIFFLDWIRGR